MLQDVLTSTEQDALKTAFPSGLVAIDLETTGLSPLVDRIIEISLIKWTPQQTTIQTHFVDPEREVPPESTAIHGITNQMLVGAPALRTVLTTYKDFVGDLPLLAHNAKFDGGFLIFNLHREGLTFGANPVYCSCSHARRAFPEMPNYKLSTLTEELKIPLESHHRAEDDAVASLVLFAKSLLHASMPVPEFTLADFAKNRQLELPAGLEGLTKKVRQGHIIEIRYKGGTHKNQWRPIQCVSLLPLPHGNVLYAKCLLSQHYKSFLLHRIVDWREVSAEQSALLHQEAASEK